MKPLLRQVLEGIAPRIGLTPEVVNLLVCGSETMRVEADRRLCGTGASGDVVILVLDGAGRVECLAPGAEPIIVQLVPPGQFVRLPTGRPGVVRAPALRAVAHVDSWVAVIGTPLLATVLARLPNERLLRLMAYSWRALSRHLYDRCRMPLLRLGDRLLLTLEALAHDFGQPCPDGTRIALRVTHSHLAQLVGGSRSAVCRTLGQLADHRRVLVRDDRFVLPAASPPAAALAGS